MAYKCTNCGWEGPREDTLTPQDGDHRCPECIAEAVPAHQLEEPDDDEDDGDWTWNPTIRAGHGGREIEPGEDAHLTGND